MVPFSRHTFCCAPINRRMPFVTTMFLKIVRQFSLGEVLTFDWLCHQVGWPFSPPDTIIDLVHLEAVHDVFDLYLWLSYRFPVRPNMCANFFPPLFIYFVLYYFRRHFLRNFCHIRTFFWAVLLDRPSIE